MRHLKKAIRRLAEDYDNTSGANYWGERAAGVLLIAEDTWRILVALRSDDVNEPNTWGTIGGKVDDDETFEQAVIRELREEGGYSGPVRLIPAYKFVDEDVFEYQNFIGRIPHEVSLETDWETSAFEWVTVEELDELSPKHPGLEMLLSESGSMLKQAMSIRTLDSDELTEAYIKYITSSDPDKITDYLEMYNTIHDYEEEEAYEDDPAFKEWMIEEVDNEVYEAFSNLQGIVTPDGTVKIYRMISVDENWLEHLQTSGKHLGICWSWDMHSADNHWGKNLPHYALLISEVNEEYVDWKESVMLNVSMPEEREVRLFKNTPINLIDIYIDNEPQKISELGLNEKQFLA